jgi:phage gp46-like protein
MELKYQGDPKLTISPYEDGGINYYLGQPIMDTGLENAVIISLGTKKGWWGNLLMKKESQKIGSNYDELTHDILNFNQLRKIEKETEKILSWMINEGIIESVDSVVNNPQVDRIENTITIKKAPGIVETYQLNWDQQFER